MLREDGLVNLEEYKKCPGPFVVIDFMRRTIKVQSETDHNIRLSMPPNEVVLQTLLRERVFFLGLCAYRTTTQLSYSGSIPHLGNYTTTRYTKLMIYLLEKIEKLLTVARFPRIIQSPRKNYICSQGWMYKKRSLEWTVCCRRTQGWAMKPINAEYFIGGTTHSQDVGWYCCELDTSRIFNWYYSYLPTMCIKQE